MFLLGKQTILLYICFDKPYVNFCLRFQLSAEGLRKAQPETPEVDLPFQFNACNAYGIFFFFSSYKILYLVYCQCYIYSSLT